MKYAVIQLLGKQYLVEAGDTLTLPHMENAPEEVVVSDVLLTVDGDKVGVGTPLVKSATVTLKVVSEQKGDKIRVAKFKAKSRYRRVYGHRQLETTVEVKSLQF